MSHKYSLWGQNSVFIRGTRFVSLTMTLIKRANMKLAVKLNLKPISKLNLWISLPLSVICLSANANTTTTASTTSVATTTASTSAIAAPAAATSTVKAPKKEEAPSVKFGLSYDLGYSLQAQTQTDAKTGEKSRSQSLSHEFSPSMSYGEYSSFLYYAYSQDLVSTTDNGWSDLIAGAGKKAWELGSYLKLGPSITMVFPMTDKSRNEVGLLYAVSGALKLSLNTKAIGMDALKLSYQAQLSRANLQYDTNAKTGNPNRLYGYRNRFDIGYDITDALSFSTRFDFNSNYSVNGVVSNTFSHFQSFGYTINDNSSVSITHSNEGAYLKSGSYENNLKFYSEEDSTYSLGLSLSI